ncbi:MAG: outer membrane beta-barrel protein [Alphaproteobacteria bacterium]|nr:outer membrane beta-barrel protein [Alphaproteobacteria bacterium]
MKHGLLAALVGGATIMAVPAYAQSPADWSGFYFGGSAGYSEQSDDSGERILFDTNRDGSFNDTVRTGAGADAFSPGFCDGAAMGRTPAENCKASDGNLNAALRAGYDWQYGPWVIGGVAEASLVNLSDDVTAFSTTPASYTFFRDLNSTLALRARGGYAFSRYLVYGTAGVVTGEIDHAFRTTNTANSFTPSEGDDNTGYQFGGGVDAKWTENFSIGVEYLFTSLQDDDYRVAVGRGTAPTTNPFLLVNPAGTDFARSNGDFEFGTLSLTGTFRY